VIGLATVIANTAVRIYDSAQRARRLQLQLAGPTAIAEAIARCIDDAHAAARDVPASSRPAEAASVRASASQVLAEILPSRARCGRPAGRQPDGLGARSSG